MHKLTLGMLLLSLSTTVVHAQETPKADISAGYSLLFIPKGFTLTMNGGSVAGAVNLNEGLAVLAHVGA